MVAMALAGPLVPRVRRRPLLAGRSAALAELAWGRKRSSPAVAPSHGAHPRRGAAVRGILGAGKAIIPTLGRLPPLPLPALAVLQGALPGWPLGNGAVRGPTRTPDRSVRKPARQRSRQASRQATGMTVHPPSARRDPDAVRVPPPMGAAIPRGPFPLH